MQAGLSESRIFLYKPMKQFTNLLWILALLGCSSTMPEWVNIHPTDDQYWHGIGRSEIKSVSNPKKQAKHAAIHELSQQIKVNITSEMKTVMKEDESGLSQSSSAILKSRVELLLPELEIVGHYKTKSDHYVYVRLNKNKYNQAMARLRENAKESALAYIREGDKEFGINAFLSLQKAWDEIQPFIDEPISAMYGGSHENLYALIKRKSKSYTHQIELGASSPMPKMKTFIDRQNEIVISVLDKKSKTPLSKIPVNLTFNGKSNLFYSNNEGEVQFPITSQNIPGKLTFNYQLDLSNIIEENSTQSPLFSKSSTHHSYFLTVNPVAVNIQSNELNLGKEMGNMPLTDLIENHFSGKMEFVKIGGDMKLAVEANTHMKSERINENFPFFAYGNASISFTDTQTGETFFSKKLSNVKGGDFSSIQVAGIRAYENMEKQLTPALIALFSEN